MHFETARRARRGPGLTPLIDIVFLLIVFFMLASSFDSEAALPLRVHPDQALAAADASRSSRDHLTVEISSNDQIRLGGIAVAHSDLPQQLAKAATAEPLLRLRVLAAPNASVEAIARVLSAAGSAGIDDVRLGLDSAASPEERTAPSTTSRSEERRD